MNMRDEKFVKLSEILSLRFIDLSNTVLGSNEYIKYILNGYYVYGTKVKIEGDLPLGYYTNTHTDTYKGKLPDSVKIVGYLTLDEADFFELPEYLWVTKSMFMNNMKNLKKLPKDLRVGVDFVATGCTSLEELPKSIPGRPYMGGVKSINLDNCTSLKTLPENLNTHILHLTGCTTLESLPKGLQASYIYANDCTSLTSLPDDLKAVELRLEGCTRLPKNISKWTKNVMSVYR